MLEIDDDRSTDNQSALNEPSLEELPLSVEDLEEPEVRPEHVGSRTTAITHYLNSVTNNAFEQYDDIVKQIAYIVLIILFALVAFGYIYAQPGTGMKIKWGRSVKKLNRLSKNMLPSLKESALGFYPFVHDVLNVANIILNNMSD